MVVTLIEEDLKIGLGIEVKVETEEIGKDKEVEEDLAEVLIETEVEVEADPFREVIVMVEDLFMKDREVGVGTEMLETEVDPP